MVEILTGGIGGIGFIARTTGRQDVCTTILPPGALAGKHAFRKHFVSCNQTLNPFSSCVDLDYTLVQIRGKYFLGPGTENVSPFAKKPKLRNRRQTGVISRRRKMDFPFAAAGIASRSQRPLPG